MTWCVSSNCSIAYTSLYPIAPITTTMSRGFGPSQGSFVIFFLPKLDVLELDLLTLLSTPLTLMLLMPACSPPLTILLSVSSTLLWNLSSAMLSFCLFGTNLLLVLILARRGINFLYSVWSNLVRSFFSFGFSQRERSAMAASLACSWGGWPCAIEMYLLRKSPDGFLPSSWVPKTAVCSIIVMFFILLCQLTLVICQRNYRWDQKHFFICRKLGIIFSTYDISSTFISLFLSGTLLLLLNACRSSFMPWSTWKRCSFLYFLKTQSFSLSRCLSVVTWLFSTLMISQRSGLQWKSLMRGLRQSYCLERTTMEVGSAFSVQQAFFILSKVAIIPSNLFCSCTATLSASLSQCMFTAPNSLPLTTTPTNSLSVLSVSTLRLLSALSFTSLRLLTTKDRLSSLSVLRRVVSAQQAAHSSITEWGIAVRVKMWILSYWGESGLAKSFSIAFEEEGSIKYATYTFLKDLRRRDSFYIVETPIYSTQNIENISVSTFREMSSTTRINGGYFGIGANAVLRRQRQSSRRVIFKYIERIAYYYYCDTPSISYCLVSYFHLSRE